VKSLLTILISLSLFQVGNAQFFSRVDSIVSNYPRSYKNEKKISARINKDFQTPVDRARAIYTWVALNIEYSAKGQLARPRRYTNRSKIETQQIAFHDKLARHTLKNRKAVCEGYAVLFWKICQLSGIESVVVTGTAKTTNSDIGTNSGANHAWNAIKINDQWHLVDVTWGSGYFHTRSKTYRNEFNDLYFMTPPELFFLRHFPNDTQWLLTDKNASDFLKLPLYHEQYLQSAIEIEAPQTGIIQATAGAEIVFNLIVPEPLKLSYAYHNDRYSTEIKYDLENGKANFTVPVLAATTSYLTIYYTSKALVTYKIETKSGTKR
jgi:transglutaminase/protease-like cytokinesis protein 3